MSEGERQPLLANGPTNNAAAPSVAVTLPDTNVVRPPYVEHQGSKRAYMRDMILGVNDGLVSMFLLILGVSGGGLTTTQILLTGITGAAAGAVSMAAGEYLATKSQNEVTDGELELEKVHFKYYREVEVAQVRSVLSQLRLTGQLLEDATSAIASDDESLMFWMKMTEFGVSESDSRTPIMAMLVSGCLFLLGSIPSVLPFACTSDIRTALIGAAVLAGLSMIMVGAFKGYFTRSSMLRGGLENTVVAAVGAALCYSIGFLYSSRAGAGVVV
mmetsp:Transcript_18479/g.30384  ORF Transcript_18479/g.30384 Transcript_18479/m.30384 type:complete len:272 (+) Transcript_18479:147-962(+)|eukprot:CAMPEP_0184650600 /NCGR_PEP_ID=MMETSP0308-20130426/8167_1 /TAXON_ID=38269 /ORGANISM="Gloeochaete witrockiana, Strain SAG 46.84" /LENGTH=271 /DNA_ID=CAMNT_0027084269 /DNA_START=126 /DNA_END=941 /DNA_ORIENTATION=-